MSEDRHAKRRSALRYGLLAAALLLSTQGCWAYRLPRRLDSSETAVLSEGRAALRAKALDVGVEPYKWSAHSDSLVAALRATRLFAEVDYLDEFETPPPLRARVADIVRGGPSGTAYMAQLFTLSLIPWKGVLVQGHDFELAWNGGAVPVKLTVTCEFVDYWFAGVRAVDDEWGTWGTPGTSDRYYDMLALEILRSTSWLDSDGPR